jgi:dipeptidyl aminopeptidase/acylaminoacyl peptidase
MVLVALAFIIPSTARAQKADAKSQPKAAAKARTVRQYTIEQFMDTTRTGGLSFSADEKQVLFHSNKTGIFNVYSVSVAGGAAKQLTNSTKESTYAVSYFPSDARFIYTYDRGGNENSHLYVRETDGKERDLTPGEKTKASFSGWSFDRKSFFYTTNERDPRFFDIYEMTIADFKPTLIYKDETGLEVGDISNDKRFIAFQKNGATTNDSDVYLYDTATKEMKNITEHKGDVANSPQSFDPASKYLYLLSDAGGEFRYVARDPSTQLDFLRETSPLFHADKITRPLIVLQGANDQRVIKPESDEIAENIKKRGGVVEYVVFDNEGHGFTKKANEIRAYKAILDFLDKHLKENGA